MAKVTISVTLETQWGPLTVTREIEVEYTMGIEVAMRELAHEMAHEAEDRHSNMYWGS